MTRELYHRVDELERQVDAILEHGTTAAQRSSIAEALDPDAGDDDSDDDQEDDDA